MDIYKDSPASIRDSHAFKVLVSDIKQHGTPKSMRMGQNDYRYVNVKFNDGFWNSYIMTNDYEDTNAFWEWVKKHFKPLGVKVSYKEMIKHDFKPPKGFGESVSKACQFLEGGGDGPLNSTQIASMNKAVGKLLDANMNSVDFKFDKSSGHYVADVTHQAGVFNSVIEHMDVIATIFDRTAVLELEYNHGNLASSGHNGKKLDKVYIAFDGDKATVHNR